MGPFEFENGHMKLDADSGSVLLSAKERLAGHMAGEIGI
jgi:hypothetical protein